MHLTVATIVRNEAGRFAQWLQDTGTAGGEEPTEWEQNEYFDFF